MYLTSFMHPVHFSNIDTSLQNIELFPIISV